MRNQQFPPQGGLEKATSAEASIKQIDELKNILSAKKGDGTFKFVGEKAPAFGDKDAQRYNIIRKDFSDRLLRLRSGAQINESEFKRLSQLLPTAWRYDEIDIQKLSDFEKEFGKVANRINQGYKWNGNAFTKSSNPLTQGVQDSNQDMPTDPKELYNQLREQGLTREEAKKQAGLI